MAKSRCLVRCSLPAVAISRRACVLGSPPCKANDPGIDDAATWQEMPKSIRRRERVERVVPVSMSRFLLSFVSKVSHASSIFQSSFVRQAIRWINLGEVPGVLPKGLSVRRYTVSVRGSSFWSSRERQRRPNNSLGLSASVISMLDSLHLSKVVEGDLAWP